MKPLDFGPAWWPDNLGSPATSGAQNGMRYAVFPDRQRLIIDRDGAQTTYDTGDHHISGVSQQNSGAASLTFTSQHGPVRLDDLKKL